ncbi:MAG: peroxide stress protein YaaA [Burkholderiaceae bacterium]|nr:peroxide stress protein YaaA [Burkholderiaceae bacterium]
MLIVLSPAKSLDFQTPISTNISTVPELLDEAEELVSISRGLSELDLIKLMEISPALARLNVDRFRLWTKTPDSNRSRQAIFAFNGDVYEGLNAASLQAHHLTYLQKHVRILSGLYGVLRPMDQLQAYRLEMGTSLMTPRGKNLYQFWGQKVTDLLNGQLRSLNEKVLINLASEEYFKVVKPASLDADIINPVFQDWKNGRYKIISFYAKRARGLMARYCAENAIADPELLKNFNVDGYLYDEEASAHGRWVFRRRTEEI